MLDNDIRLVIEILRCSSKSYYEAESAEQYVKVCAEDIRPAGKMLEFLGLAQPDRKSPIGWKPTQTLMGLIARRVTQPTSQQKFRKAEWIIEMLKDLAIYDAEYEAAMLGFCLLQKLGLVRGGEKPYVSDKLISLIGSGYWQQRQRRRMNEVKQISRKPNGWGAKSTKPQS